MKNGYAFEIQEVENDNGQIGLAVVIGGLVSIFVQYGETLGPVSSILVMRACIVCEVQRGSDTDASDS